MCPSACVACAKAREVGKTAEMVGGMCAHVRALGMLKTPATEKYADDKMI